MSVAEWCVVGACIAYLVVFAVAHTSARHRRRRHAEQIREGHVERIRDRYADPS